MSEALPSGYAEIDALAASCKAMVKRRAMVSAGVSALPIPGVDIATDVGLFTMLVEDINRAFGLSEAQVARLDPSLRVIAYQAAVSVGGMMVGKLVTRKLVGALFRKAGTGVLARTAAKAVPLAGQLASAAIGFGVFRNMGDQHVDACAAVARELLAARTVAS